MQFDLLCDSRDFGRKQWMDGTALADLEGIEIEIGPGSCGYLLAAALASPRRLHVGIEIHPASLRAVRSRQDLPANLRLIEGDGGWIVQNLLAPASIDAYHVYFPDPWWKKRHHKRRLFQPDLCRALARTLVPGGAVHVVTDVVPLFTEICERMEEAGFRAEPWLRDPNDPVCSSYERKYRRQGRHFEMTRFCL